MWIELTVRPSVEGAQWHLRSINLQSSRGGGLLHWERRGSCSMPPADTYASADVLVAALRDILARLGDREHLDVAGS